MSEEKKRGEGVENEELSEEKIKKIKAMEKRVIERITEPEGWEE